MIICLLNSAKRLVQWSLFGIAFVLFLFGLRHGRFQQRRWAWSNEIKGQSIQRAAEIQNEQLQASLAVRGDRDTVAERMRAGKF